MTILEDYIVVSVGEVLQQFGLELSELNQETVLVVHNPLVQDFQYS